MKMMKTLWVSMLSVGMLCACAPKAVKYSITFKNGEAVLQTLECAENEMPFYSGEKPTKVDETGEYEYTWTGWSPSVVPAEADAEYLAVFKEERVNWSKAERDLMVEKLTVTLPFFANAEEWEWDEDYECLSTSAELTVEAVEAIFKDAEYEVDYDDFSDPEFYEAALTLVLSEEAEIQVDVYGFEPEEGEEPVAYVDAYYAVPAKEPDTIEGVIQDISNAVFGSAVLNEDYFSDGEDGFYCGVIFGDGGESLLENLCKYACSFVPEYMGDAPVVGPTATKLKDGSPAYTAAYLSEKKTVVQILCYVYETATASKLVAQYSVYSLAD